MLGKALIIGHAVCHCFLFSLAALFTIGGCGKSPQTDKPTDTDVLTSQSTAPPPASTSIYPDGQTSTALVDLASQVQLAEQHIAAGQIEQAGRILREVLLIEPTHAAANFDLAAVQVAMGRRREAIDLLDSIPAEHPQLGVPARGRAADLCMELELYSDAIQRYLTLLEANPGLAYAHRQVAYLLNRQGRRHEAATHLRALCELGDIRQDELHALMVVSDAIYDDPDAPDSNDPRTRKYVPIGAWGEARIMFSDDRFVDAANLLRDECQERKAPPAIQALYGRCLAEAQADNAFLDWFAACDPLTRQQAEYWAAVGAWLLNQQKFPEAVRALAEAVLKDPTDVRSYRRMHSALTALGRHQDAEKWDERHQWLRTTTLTSNQLGNQRTPDAELLAQVIDGLQKLDRSLEAVMWESIAAYVQQGEQADLSRLNQQRKSLVASDQGFPSNEQKICGLAIEDFPKPDLDLTQRDEIASLSQQPVVEPTQTPIFGDIAQQIGLSHTYRIASQPVEAGLTIYQVLGGGVAALDYDLDGNCDLYFTQGQSSPPDFMSSQSNQLFRQMDDRVTDVTQSAAAEEFRYSTGLTAGDWNQDGFPDLVVGNLGVNTLLINCGDGTFRSSSTDATDDVTMVTSSLGMGDLTGDGLPDVFEQLYVHDAAYDMKPSVNDKGQLEIVSPFDYRPGMDRVLVNDGTGQIQVTPISRQDNQGGTGLGIILADFGTAPDSPSRNQIYVGNDLRPNQLWSRTSAGEWSDSAPMLGCSLGHDGSRTASMGIAAGDFDRNGRIDLHITNFEDASARLYLNRGKSFQDRSITFGLADDSYEVLGFGTQSIDYNLDGLEDLVVANGHVENTGIEGSPFRQPPQLFVNHGNRFVLTTVADGSGYFNGLHVGRAVARLDFNRDGKPDFAVTHIESPSALVINQTETNHHWLQVQLVGTGSERDAIGAVVQVKSTNQTWTGWATSGDGYLCRNESVLFFGLGAMDHIDEIIVQWPSRAQSKYSDIAVDQRVLLIENFDSVFTLAAAGQEPGQE